MLRGDKIGDNYSNFRPLLVFHASSIPSAKKAPPIVCACAFHHFHLHPKVTCVENPRNEKRERKKEGNESKFYGFLLFYLSRLSIFPFLPLAYRPSHPHPRHVDKAAEEGRVGRVRGDDIRVCVLVNAALNTGKWNLHVNKRAHLVRRCQTHRLMRALSRSAIR